MNSNRLFLFAVAGVALFGAGMMFGNPWKRQAPREERVEDPTHIVVVRPTLPTDHPAEKESSHRTIVLRVMKDNDPRIDSPRRWSVVLGHGEQKHTRYYADPEPVSEAP